MATIENTTQGKEKALEEALKKIVKEFGTGAIMKLGERPEQKYLSFQVVLLD